MTNAPPTDIDERYDHELDAAHEDVRGQAALAAFLRLQPTNDITVGQFLDQLQGHKDMWAVVRALGIADFAAALARRPARPAGEDRPRRTRISDEQKSSLQKVILRVLESHGGGMNRNEITAVLIDDGLVPLGIEPDVLGEKVRQPLYQLIAEGKLHTIGEKRLMRYMVGPAGAKPQ
jgi:hypothetical protein